MFSLQNHTKQYSFSCYDFKLTAVTGFSGIAYGSRHWQLAKTLEETQGSCKLCHRVIAVIECIPVLGAVAALIERVVFAIWQRCRSTDEQKPQTTPQPPATEEEQPVPEPVVEQVQQQPVQHRPLGQIASLEQAQAKMWKNTEKAIREHAKKDQAYVQEIVPLDDVKPGLPLILLQYSAEAKGTRPSMEDAHFFMETEKDALVGVLDGHGGKMIAEYARDQFQERFFNALQEAKGNVHVAFETLFDSIQNEIREKKEWNDQGSTAVVSYIDKQTHRVYTATLGDSEANIYRVIKGKTQSIPLSCVRDWSSQKDATRASIACQEPSIAQEWPQAENPKFLRFPSLYCGVNVSRSLGDVSYTSLNNSPGVIHKPKITMFRLQSGDTFVLACDGVKDYMTEGNIITALSAESDNPAETLVQKTLPASSDNITAVVVKVM